MVRAARVKGGPGVDRLAPRVPFTFFPFVIPLPRSVNGGIVSHATALQEFNGLMYVAGNFNSVGAGSCPGAGCVVVNKIATLDSAYNWGALPCVAPCVGTGVGLNNAVNAMAVFNGALWMVGTFTDFGNAAGGAGSGTTAAASRPYGLVGWTGSAWLLPGCGTCNSFGSYPKYALAVLGDLLVIGGSFTAANPQTGTGPNANGLITWDGGSKWGVMPTGATNGIGSGTIFALAVAGNNLYAGGSFTSLADATVANHLAMWR